MEEGVMEIKGPGARWFTEGRLQIRSTSTVQVCSMSA